jgi:hypothetical protein
MAVASVDNAPMNVVTGMHRSGTSLVAMTLDALGLDFGDHEAFYTPDEWNEEGYFERRDVIDLNSRILTGFTRTRNAFASSMGKVRYLSQPSRQSITRRANSLRGEIDSLATLLGETYVKDPRFVLTAECWRPHLERVVVCLRRPDQVALSLKRRQRVPLAISYRFWDYHARAILSLGHERVHYVDFDVLAGDAPSEELVGLVRFLHVAVPEDDLMDKFRSRFAPGLKHFDKSDEVDLPSPTRELWDQLVERRSTPIP